MCAVCVHLVGVCICLGVRVHMCMWCVYIWLCVHVRDIYVHVGHVYVWLCACELVCTGEHMCMRCSGVHLGIPREMPRTLGLVNACPDAKCL